ncbi:MAG: ROK family protein [Planctomycetes bacterium]|nr:ROK family protein [Planctomycetota bacterium]
MNPQALYLAIDIGAGHGAKIGLFDEAHTLLGESFLAQKSYGESAESLADALALTINAFLNSKQQNSAGLKAAGISTPGMLCSDGSYLLAHNLQFLNNRNLPELLSQRLGIPVGIENDANAGGLAEWSILKEELLYWVFGGGWGGSWISRDGKVRFSSLDWNGKDPSLHYTNEPGYSVPLEKKVMRERFQGFKVSYDEFEKIVIADLSPAEEILTGPSGSPDHLRAETIVSGPGRCRLFRAVVGQDGSYTQYLKPQEVEEITDPAVAGKHISKLSGLGVEAALTTDKLFGMVLAEAAQLIINQAVMDGCSKDVPICLGGKPSLALPYFGPTAGQALAAKGLINSLQLSVLSERGSNANLVGACVVAQNTYRDSIA